MRKYNPVRHYLKEPKWLRDNLASIHAGKGPLQLYMVVSEHGRCHLGIKDMHGRFLKRQG